MADMIKKGILMHVVMAIVCAMCSFVGGVTLSVLMGALLYAAYIVVMYGEGCGFGEHACTVRDTVRKLESEGKKPSDDMEKESYDPKKGLIAALVLAAPLVLLALANLLAANPRSAGENLLGVITRVVNLPSAFLTRLCTEAIVTEIDGAKQAAITVLKAFEYDSALDINFDSLATGFRPIIMYGSAVDVSMLTLMRLLFIPSGILPGLSMFIGYLQGPRLREKTVKDMLKGSRKKRKKLKMFGGNKQRKVRGPEI